MVKYGEAFQLIWSTCKQEWKNRGPTKNFIFEFFVEMKNYFCLQTNDAILCLITALLFTIIRRELTSRLLHPTARLLNFNSKCQQTFPECTWKFIIYLAFYVAECIILFQRYPDLLYDFNASWEGWKVCLEVPTDIYGIYIAEMGFYIHGIYATLFLDIWRDDSIVMLLHHLLTISLLLFSLAVRYHRIGLVVLFLHDIADVCLEFTKMVKCFQENDTQQRKSVFSYITVIGFISFATAWISCRICLYPTIVLYSTGYVARQIFPEGPFYFFFNGMLWLLFLMNIYWLYYIVLLIYRIITGKSKHIEDTRETTICYKENKITQMEKENLTSLNRNLLKGEMRPKNAVHGNERIDSLKKEYHNGNNHTYNSAKSQPYKRK